MFTEECINTFLENQEQLFPQPVAESYEAAEAFLEDCMAQVVDSIEEVREYLEEAGADVEGMSDEELEDASEVFAPAGWKISDSRRIKTVRSNYGYHVIYRRNNCKTQFGP